VFEETEEMGQAFGYVEQISGDENPIRGNPFHRFDDPIMPRVISVKMQIREMDGTMAGQGRMCMGEDRDIVIG
jgi:hypothetical protein